MSRNQEIVQRQVIGRVLRFMPMTSLLHTREDQEPIKLNFDYVHIKCVPRPNQMLRILIAYKTTDGQKVQQKINCKKSQIVGIRMAVDDLFKLSGEIGILKLEGINDDNFIKSDSLRGVEIEKLVTIATNSRVIHTVLSKFTSGQLKCVELFSEDNDCLDIKKMNKDLIISIPLWNIHFTNDPSFFASLICVWRLNYDLEVGSRIQFSSKFFGEGICTMVKYYLEGDLVDELCDPPTLLTSQCEDDGVYLVFHEDTSKQDPNEDNEFNYRYFVACAVEVRSTLEEIKDLAAYDWEMMKPDDIFQ